MDSSSMGVNSLSLVSACNYPMCSNASSGMSASSVYPISTGIISIII